MKTIDKFRHTRRFCLDGTDVRDLVVLMSKVPAADRVVAVGKEYPDQQVYTVRLMDEHNQLVDRDYLVVGQRATIIDEQVIIATSEKRPSLKVVA